MEGNNDRVVQVPHVAENIGDLAAMLGRHGLLDLQNADLFIVFADLDIFLQGGDAQVDAVMGHIHVKEQERAQLLKGGFTDDLFHAGEVFGVGVMDHDIVAVCGALYIGFHAEVGLAIARGDERLIGVAPLQTEKALVGNDFNVVVCEFDGGWHRGISLFINILSYGGCERQKSFPTGRLQTHFFGIGLPQCSASVLLPFFFFVKAMNPIGAFVVNEIDHRADQPSDGIGPIDETNVIGEVTDQLDVGNAERAPNPEHDEHGDKGLACPAAHGGNRMGERQQEVKERDGMRLHGAVFDHLRGIVKERNEHFGVEIGEKPDDLRRDHREQDPEGGALLGPVVQPGTEVLANEGGSGHVKADDGQECKALDLGVSAVGRRGKFAKRIDLGLHQHVGKRDNRILHTGWEPVTNDLTEHVPADLQLFPFHRVDVALFAQMDHAQHHTNELRDDGGHRRRANAHPKHGDKEPIQEDVKERRYDQVVQRPAAVPEGIHNTAADVIHDQCQRAHEIVAKIGNGAGEHVGIGLHESEHIRGKDYAHDRQQNAAEHAEHDVGMDGAGDLVAVIGAEIAGYDDTRAHGRAVEEAHKQKDQGAG